MFLNLLPKIFFYKNDEMIFNVKEIFIEFLNKNKYKTLSTVSIDCIETLKLANGSFSFSKVQQKQRITEPTRAKQAGAVSSPDRTELVRKAVRFGDSLHSLHFLYCSKVLFTL